MSVYGLNIFWTQSDSFKCQMWRLGAKSDGKESWQFSLRQKHNSSAVYLTTSCTVTQCVEEWNAREVPKCTAVCTVFQICLDICKYNYILFSLYDTNITRMRERERERKREHGIEIKSSPQSDVTLFVLINALWTTGNVISPNTDNNIDIFI